MLRVERRIHPRCRASQLQFLPNPFNVIQMVHTDSLRPLLTGMIPDQFFDSVRVRLLPMCWQPFRRPSGGPSRQCSGIPRNPCCHQWMRSGGVGLTC